MGMNVIYYDVVSLMALGSARQVPTLQDLLNQADFVTLHVPELPETKNMISAPQLAHMKEGSYLINASRGTVVDIPALVNAMRSGKIAGAALDVFPTEPRANGDYFNNSLNGWDEELRSVNNIILTPHIGGSTEEAQRAIGVEGMSSYFPLLIFGIVLIRIFSLVSDALVQYINQGVTIGSVNMPEVSLRSMTSEQPDYARVSNLPTSWEAKGANWSYRSSLSIKTSQVSFVEV